MTEPRKRHYPISNGCFQEKIYGIELQQLLLKARRNWRFVDQCFLKELFKQFIEGLRDSEQRTIGYDAWIQDFSIADLFLAIDNYNTKKVLLAGRGTTKGLHIHDRRTWRRFGS